MSNARDSKISISSDTKDKNVVIHIDDLSDEKPPAADKDTSPSIESNSVNHVTVPRPTSVFDDQSNNNSAAQSTTVLDIDDGAGGDGKEIADRSYKKLRDNIILGIVIAIVCGVILTPIILFYTRPDFSNPFESVSTQTNHRKTCNTYNSQTCGIIENSRLFYYEDQDSAESTLSAIFNITSSDQDCANLAPAFFCNATYRSCDDMMLTPTAEECEMLRNDSCSSQWAQLQNISSILTDCDMYNPPSSRTCPKQFRPSNGGACIPLCSEFSQNNEEITILVNIVIGVISNCGNLIGGIVVFILAFFRRKAMFKFPQVLILYSSATVTITVTVITISNFGADVLCSDENLFMAISNPTAYCEIYGFTFQAGFLIFSGFWFLFVAHLFLKLVFPIQFHNFDNFKHRTKVHIAEIVIVPLIGLLIASIVAGTSEYRIVNFPPTQCAVDVEVTFYTLILPTIFIQGAGMMLILFSFVSIHRRKGIFKRSRGNKRIWLEFTTPEVKLLLTFLYFTVVLCFYWADFSTSLRNRNRLLTAMFDYISCVNNVNSGGRNCEELREDIYAASVPALRVVALLLTSLVNAGNVVFVLQFRDVKERIRTLKRRITAKANMDGSNQDTMNASKQFKETM